MLSAKTITGMIGQDALEWQGPLRGNGLLLTLGSPLQPLTASDTTVVDLTDQSSIDRLYGEPVTAWDTYELAPGEIVLGGVQHPLRLGAGLMGVIGGLSHLARVGLAIHITSPFVLPGWHGHVTLELVNTGPATLRLHHGMPLARLLLIALDALHSGDNTGPHPFYGREADLKSRYADEFFDDQTER